MRGDIVECDVDALVNAANRGLRGGGGVDGAIHRAAGPGLLDECIRRYPDGCPTGGARITGGHRLKARFVIHTPGPIWQGGDVGEAELLASCHRESLRVGVASGCETFAFPAISCGVYGYPREQAARIALRTVVEELARQPAVRSVSFVLFDDDTLACFESARREIVGDAAGP